MWSDNEDDVFIDNKTRDVMGIETLSDNIISADFSDDDEELFGANNSLDLNIETEPEMGVKFQASQDYSNSWWMASSDSFYGFYFENPRRRDLKTIHTLLASPVN